MKMFVWSFCDGFLCALILLMIIFIMERYYVYFWGWVKMCGICVCTFLMRFKLKSIEVNTVLVFPITHYFNVVNTNILVRLFVYF